MGDAISHPHPAPAIHVRSIATWYTCPHPTSNGKIPKNGKKTAKRALLLEEETPQSPPIEPDFTLEPQGEAEPQFVTLQDVEFIGEHIDLNAAAAGVF